MAPRDSETRALWHLELGYADFEPLGQEMADVFDDDFEDPDDGVCEECGLIFDECECHIGDECGRWRNGDLSESCSKAGSEECDFECPYRASLRFG